MDLEFNEKEFKENVEDALREEVVEEAEGEEVGEEVEYSPIEEEAIKHGWRPDGVEGKRNLSADEFLDRQKLYDEIKHLKMNSKEMQKAFEALSTHHKRVAEAERAKIISELKLQKRLALEADDYDKVMELDDRLVEANKEPEDVLPEIVVSTNNEAFDEWVVDNRWYMNDRDMRDWADILGDRYFKENPGTPLSEVYAKVTKEIKTKFPEKFGEKRKPSASAVDSGSRRTSKAGAGSKKYSAKDLPEDAFQMMKTIVRSGAVTEEQYLKEFFESA